MRDMIHPQMVQASARYRQEELRRTSVDLRVIAAPHAPHAMVAPLRNAVARRLIRWGTLLATVDGEPACAQ